MKPTPLLLLGTLAFNAGCSSCSQKPTQPTVTPAPVLPVAANNNIIPSKSTVTAVFFTAKDKTRFWMETISGTRAAPPESSYWTGQGIIVPENDGWHTYLTDGTSFGTATVSAEGLTTTAELLKKQTQAPTGYEWVVEVGSNGFHKVFIHPALGKRQRIGMFPEPPSAPVWMEGERPSPQGAEVPMLSKAAGFQTRDDSKLFKNEPPVGSTPTAKMAASPEDLTAWSTAFTALRGAPVTIDLSQMIDLDADGVAEGFACITGGRGSPCHVIDAVGEELRFYTTTIQWTPGNPEFPQYFSTDKGSYITHSPENAITNRGGGIIRLVRFNGSGFITETIQ